MASTPYRGGGAPRWAARTPRTVAASGVIVYGPPVAWPMSIDGGKVD
ncbi:MAG: hypothetical protein M3400_07400 [Actinomycetota bacterium]|nr:hypothetical protein [Actinomycetota bacterium]